MTMSLDALLLWAEVHSWDLTALAIYIGLSMCIGRLYCTAPDAAQKIIWIHVIAAMLSMIGFYAWNLYGEADYYLKLIAYKLAFMAMVLVVLRLFWIEVISCKKSRASSPN
jgi:hypothetical protein